MDTMKKRFAITTLGCKVNQCESSALGRLLVISGYRPGSVDDRTDLIVINTCTVTGKAAMQSRQAIRQAVRNHPNSKVVVTGCYAQTAPDEIKAIDGIAYIVGHADKMEIASVIEKMAPVNDGPAIVHKNMQQVRCFDPMPSVAPESRTRAFLKIQDGCNAFCTYCIVPHARGRSRSMPVADALNHLDDLAQTHFKEVVLTGIHLGEYGKDLSPKSSLYHLLCSIKQRNAVGRVRLSSIEPTEVEPDLVALTADPGNPLCPHFHIPLQSGDDSILKRMGRSYTRNQFAETIHNIRHAMPHGAIGLDVLVGFPGENDHAFDQTFSLIEALDITYLHVFPFSPRKGTPAAGFKDKVPDRVVKERCRYLRQLGREKKARFYRSNIDHEVKVLIENCDKKANLSKGMSENYIPVVLPDTQVKENSIVTVRIQKVESDLTVIGTIALNARI
jgi:threonylcarbamoyladenosine tRNA methylthiotransferase MtaB